jgi:hypothetical protein
MSDIGIGIKNVLIYPFDRGIDVAIIVDSLDYDFTEFVEMYSDVKETYSLTEKSILTLELNDGLFVETVTVDDKEYKRLTIFIDQLFTQDFGQNSYYMDVKGLKAGSNKIFLIMRIVLKKDETGTNVPNVT